MSLLILGQIVIALLAFCACECNLCAHDFHLHLIDVGVLFFCESSLPHRWVRPSPQNYGEAGRQRRQTPRVGVNSLPHRTLDFTDPGCHIRPEADIISPHKKEEPWFFHSLLRIARGNARVNRLFRYFCLSSCRITILRSTTAIPAVWIHSRQPAGIPSAGYDESRPARRTCRPAINSFIRQNYSRIFTTLPEPTVLPPSRMAKRRPSSIATGWIRSTSISTLSPGMHISTPCGSSQTPVTSVVRK